ncbi:MAG: hypothetical protein LLF91_01815, partial [Xanthomonadaceae bacterium]|nr:hypothetical protein [Xanthomonadaceae bacterium]
MSIPIRARRTAAALTVLLLAWALAPGRAAAGGPPLTLDAAVALAVRDAPALAADAARLDAARADAVRAGR